ncbi:MAG: threonine synthase, partial [Clostridiaceae bacterium]
VKIIVFYPQEGVSPIQKLQMITQEGNNAFVIGIEGNFDDAQSGVKKLFKDEVLKEKLNSKGYFFTSANSINIGRLVPQVVYYFYSYLSLIKNKEISLGEEINFAVPTGNFGDILAGYYAKFMGLPINKLICASNENNVLYDFFSTGIYDARRKLKATSSPSMDILISSNLERLLYEISGRDSMLINNLMEDLNQKGFYKITDNMKEGLSVFYSSFATEKEVSSSIANLYERTGYLMDTHTAVAYSVLKKYEKGSKDTTKTVILSTASPFKFSNSLCRALNIEFSEKDIFSASCALSEATGISIPQAITELKEKDILHKESCAPNEIKRIVQSILNI